MGNAAGYSSISHASNGECGVATGLVWGMALEVDFNCGSLDPAGWALGALGVGAGGGSLDPAG